LSVRKKIIIVIAIVLLALVAATLVFVWSLGLDVHFKR
jgi:hypothetical protein